MSKSLGDLHKPVSYYMPHSVRSQLDRRIGDMQLDVCECMRICKYVCMPMYNIRVRVRMYVCMYMYMNISMSACVHVHTDRQIAR